MGRIVNPPGSWGLVFREPDRIFGVFAVPQLYQFITALADVFGVDDLAAEYAWQVQCVDQRIVGAVLDIQAAVHAQVGRPGAQPVDLDGADGAAEFDPVV